MPHNPPRCVWHPPCPPVATSKAAIRVCVPWRIYSNSRRSTFPGFIGSDGPVELEALLQLADLCGKRFGIARVSLEHFHRHGAAIGGAEKPIDDLQLAASAVAVVAAFG